MTSVTLLVNEVIRAWEVAAIDRLHDLEEVNISLVAINGSGAEGLTGSTGSIWRSGTLSVSKENLTLTGYLRLFYHVFRAEGPWAFVLAHRKIIRFLTGRDQSWLESHDVDCVDALDSAEFIRCNPVPTRGGELPGDSVGGVWKRPPDEVEDRIIAETDVAIRFGWGLVEGRVLDETSLGVLSFHSSDIREYRGFASAPRYLDDPDEAGATLQRLTPEIDGGQVVLIDYVDVRDCYLLEEIDQRVKELQTEMLPAGIERIRATDFTPTPPETLADYTTTKRKTNWRFCTAVIVRETMSLFQWLYYKRIIGRN